MPALPGIECLAAIPDDTDPAARILLGIKPQGLAAAAADVARLIGSGTQLLSILAGVEVATLSAYFPSAEIVRVMPNLPVRLGKGVVALYATGGSKPDVEALMAPLGLVGWIEHEGDFNLVTALSGCGPAFLYRFIDALSAAAASLGMEPACATRLALATVEGAAALAAEADDDPATLADRVASKGGATREGLNVLDDDRALVRLLEATLRAAATRSGELAKSG